MVHIRTKKRKEQRKGRNYWGCALGIQFQRFAQDRTEGRSEKRFIFIFILCLFCSFLFFFGSLVHSCLGTQEILGMVEEIQKAIQEKLAQAEAELAQGKEFVSEIDNIFLKDYFTYCKPQKLADLVVHGM